MKIDNYQKNKKTFYSFTILINIITLRKLITKFIYMYSMFLLYLNLQLEVTLPGQIVYHSNPHKRTCLVLLGSNRFEFLSIKVANFCQEVLNPQVLLTGVNFI